MFAYLDAGESSTRGFAAFLARVPADYQGAASVSYQGGRITIHERGGNAGRDITVDAGPLW
ncbi:MAG: hypothetical protein FJW40_06510 [Acidobacteria bacterium]|nr:hypothetical protein [Acidobacteriota bacterium]